MCLTNLILDQNTILFSLMGYFQNFFDFSAAILTNNREFISDIEAPVTPHTQK